MPNVRLTSPTIAGWPELFVPLPPTTPTDLLRALAAALGPLRTRWYVFGAQAVVVWGRPRMTADVDVTVELRDAAVGALVRELEGAGFQLRVAPDAGFLEASRVLPFFHATSGFALDVVLAGPGLEEAFLDRAIDVDLGGVVVPVIAPEDLVVTKVLAGRPKDIEDVRGVLLERLPDLDVAAIRGTLILVERALGQSDLTPVFEAELERAQRIRGRR